MTIIKKTVQEIGCGTGANFSGLLGANSIMHAQRNLNISVVWFLTTDGSCQLPTGGMERWCRDVALLAQKQGYTVRIYQKSQVAFEHEITPSIHVIGVPASLSSWGNIQFAKWLEANVNPDEPMLFVSQELCLSKQFTRCVGVNHGIWWDGDYPVWKKLLIKRLHRRLISQMRGTICVDTNYINWCHAELPNRTHWQAKLAYIPNYADCEIFPKKVTETPKREKIVLLYPRRLMGKSIDTDERGIGILLAATRILLRRGVDVQLKCVGRGCLASQVMQWANAHGLGERVQVSEMNLDGMADVYCQSDVVVIPSIAHEGTSLAAIEALVCGRPVVATHIGGLPNIIIDGITGYMSDLSAESLASAIEKAIQSGSPSAGFIDMVRTRLGKVRWESQIWSYLENKLHL